MFVLVACREQILNHNGFLTQQTFRLIGFLLLCSTNTGIITIRIVSAFMERKHHVHNSSPIEGNIFISVTTTLLPTQRIFRRKQKPTHFRHNVFHLPSAGRSTCARPSSVFINQLHSATPQIFFSVTHVLGKCTKWNIWGRFGVKWPKKLEFFIFFWWGP